MCGICGAFGNKIEYDKTLAMRGAIRHRGPDGEGDYRTVTSNGATVIMHSLRLAIVDVENGVQPMTDGHVHVVWNGELYNYVELKLTLEEKGYIFHTASDTEVILKMYREYGPEMVQYFRGMFAMAIYDEQKEALYLFRDRFGIKPLFYTKSGQNFLFASEIKALLAYDTPDNPSAQSQAATKEEDSFSHAARQMPDAVAKAFCNYLQYHGAVPPETCYANIWELEPASMLIVNRDGITKTKYYSLSFARCLPGTDISAMEYDTPYDECDVMAELRSYIYKAVKKRFVEGEPTCVLLSGGLDSAYIAALAASISLPPIYTHTLRFQCEAGKQNSKSEDVRAAEYLAKRLGTFHTTYTITGQEALDSLERIAGAFDQPYSGGVSLYWLMERVPEQYRVFLSGDGGDEAFWGYPFHSQVYDRLYRKTKNPDAENAKPQTLTMPGLPPDLWEMLLSEEMKHMLCADRHWDRETDLSLEHLAQQTNTHYYEKLLPGQVLRYVDTLSMVHGKEIRSPFMDQRVVECAASVPIWMKMRNGKPKYLLRRVASNILPSEILNRKKETFLPPVSLWMQKEWKEFILDMLSYERLKGSARFQPENVLYMLRQFYADPDKNGHIAEIIWTILMFELWAMSRNI